MRRIAFAAIMAVALAGSSAQAASIVFADNFNDNDASDWTTTPGSKGSSNHSAAGGYLETWFDAPASTGWGYAGVDHVFTLAGDATNVTLSFDAHTNPCGGCTMRYQAFIDDILAIDGTDLNWTPRSESFFDLGAGSHTLTLRHYTDGASSGHFTAFFDNVVLSADVAAAVPEPASWALMIGGLGFVGASMRRRATLALA